MVNVANNSEKYKIKEKMVFVNRKEVDRSLMNNVAMLIHNVRGIGQFNAGKVVMY